MGQSETLDSLLEETGGNNNWGGGGVKGRLNKRSGRRPNKVLQKYFKKNKIEAIINYL